MITDLRTSSLISDFFISGDNTPVLEKVNTNVLSVGNTFVLSYSTMKYGERLKAAREHAGLSQEELVRLSGVKQGTISKIERGDQNFSGFDAKLAHCLGVNALWLSEGNVKYAPDWLIGSDKTTNKKTFYSKFDSLSIDQKKEVENFLDFILNNVTSGKNQEKDKKVLTNQEVEDIRGGGVNDVELFEERRKDAQRRKLDAQRETSKKKPFPTVPALITGLKSKNPVESFEALFAPPDEGC